MASARNDLDRDVLLEQLARPQNPQMPPGASVLDPAAAPDTPASVPATPAAQTYGLEGFDAGKLASGHDSPKYQVGRVLQQFDPKAGLGQAGLMDKLNALGLGSFSANSDKLSVANGDPRFQGMNTWDSIRDQEGNAGWQFGVDSNLDSAPRGAPGMGAGGGGLASLAPTDMGTYNALQDKLKQILGGDQAFDRDALLRLMQQQG